MAEKPEALRQILQTIHDDAERALKLLESPQEKPSLSWKCQACGHMKHFTRVAASARQLRARVRGSAARWQSH